MSNRLATETSPYLLQHANNPVDWLPWGEEAFSAARERDCPILLSVGYAACHWCHVMERECFEDARIAQLMNETCVCVKVDREEHPDVDEVYMLAAVALTGSGGWPLTVFLTPKLEPFFAGTYFPPEPRGGMVAFPQLLQRIAELWRTEREQLFEQARRLSSHLRAQARIEPAGEMAKGVHEALLAQLEQSFDSEYGGFGSAPKFPPHSVLPWLADRVAFERAGGFEPASSEQASSEQTMLQATLRGMARGGIYDHLGGGFARYSTDERWIVPHFEKMLYDNALLCQAYATAYRVTGDPAHARVCRETLAYVQREMQSPEGGYYCSTDADSVPERGGEKEEGAYFVFTPEQVGELLETRDFQLFCNYYDVTPEGNFEGANVLNTPRPLARVASELDWSLADAEQHLERAREVLRRARMRRPPPALDDKVLTSWNAMMVCGMLQAGFALADEGAFASAQRSLRFACDVLMPKPGRLLHTARGRRAHIAGYLEDYAWMIQALLSWHELGWTGEGETEPPLVTAQRLAQTMIDELSCSQGGFYQATEEHQQPVARLREGADGAVPSANAVAAAALWRLGRHLGKEEYVVRARHTLQAFARVAGAYPRAHASLLQLHAQMRAPGLELVLCGEPESVSFQALLAELRSTYVPGALIVLRPSEPIEGEPSILARDKRASEQARLYVCQGRRCLAPLLTADELRGSMRSLLLASSRPTESLPES